jgi:mannose-6-phosphate isomerase-like protein (cupin superfamily)
MFRGFSNVGDSDGFLWVALGGDDPGHVQWAPYVFEMAADHGLVLLDDGTLVDTAKGQSVPPGGRLMKPTSADDVAQLRVPSFQEARSFAVTSDEFEHCPDGPLSHTGVREIAVLGPANPREGIGAGKLGWRHGFQLRRLSFDPGGSTRSHRRSEPEVLFVNEGAMEMRWAAGRLNMTAGDTLTLPVGMARTYTSHEGATVFALHGGDEPEPPQWAD